MEKKIARLISYLFHPLLMPTYGIFLVFQLNTYLTFQYTPHARRFFYLLIFTFTFLAPLLIALYLLRQNYISSLHIPNRKERWLPFLFTTMFYLFTYYLLNEINAASIFDAMIFGAALSVIVALIITFFWKISIHMVGIGGLVGIIYALTQFMAPDAHLFIAGLLLIAGLVGFSRVSLHAHSLNQVIAGFVTGAICTYIPLWIDLTY